MTLEDHPAKTVKNKCVFGHHLKKMTNLPFYYCDDALCQVAMFRASRYPTARPTTNNRKWVYFEMEYLIELVEGRLTQEELIAADALVEVA